MNNVFNERLSELIQERGLSVKEISSKTGIFMQSIYAWTKGEEYQISLANLIKICDVLECSLEFIVGRTERILDFELKICPPFYERLREVMKEKGKTRYSVVKNTKIYDNYFTVWKKGREPQLKTLIELSDYIGCTLDYLIGREQN